MKGRKNGASLELGPKLARVEELLDKSIRRSKKLSKKYYSLRIPSERFEYVTCAFFYDPDPEFKLVRIELGKSPTQKCFDVGYEEDYEQHCTWGFIDNNVELESFGVLGDVLDLAEARL